MDEEKELFLGEVKSGNEEEDTEEKKKRPHFWKGFAAGAGAMFLRAPYSVSQTELWTGCFTLKMREIFPFPV